MASAVTAVQTAVTLSNMAAAAGQTGGPPNGSAASADGQPKGRELFTDEVHSYLESVYNVSSQPEEYVKYRLHLVTRLEMRQINDWFHNRRQRERKRERESADGDAGGAPQQRQQQSGGGAAPAALLGGLLPTASGVGAGVAAGAPQNGASGLAAPLNAGSLNTAPLSLVPRLGSAEPLQAASTALAAVSHALGSAQGFARLPGIPSPMAAGGGKRRKNIDADDAPARFELSDLSVIAGLVGLQTIACDDSVRQEGVADPAAGLFLFEQLTRLDSLTLDNAPAAKRQRTRHQHFWRNSDKIPRNDRVYVQAKEVQAAQEGKGPPVTGRGVLPPGERSNAWTVALTPSGVVDYLNRKTSPLGVRLFRALLTQLGDPAGGPPLQGPTLGSQSQGLPGLRYTTTTPGPNAAWQPGRTSPTMLHPAVAALNPAAAMPVAASRPSPQPSPGLPGAAAALPGLPPLTLAQPSPLNSAGIAAAIGGGASGGQPAPAMATDGAAGWAPQPGGLPALSAIGGFLQPGGTASMLQPAASSAPTVASSILAAASGGPASDAPSDAVITPHAAGNSGASAEHTGLMDAVIQQAKRVAMPPPPTAGASEAEAPPPTSAEPPAGFLTGRGAPASADSPVEAYRRLISQQGFGMPALPLGRSAGSTSGGPGAGSPKAAQAPGTSGMNGSAAAAVPAPLPVRFREFSRTESAAARLEASAAAVLASSRDSADQSLAAAAASAVADADAAQPAAAVPTASSGTPSLNDDSSQVSSGPAEPLAGTSSADGGWASTQPLQLPPVSGGATSNEAASILDQLPQHVGGIWPGVATREDLKAYLAAKVSSSDIEPLRFPQLHGDLLAVAAQHGFNTMQSCPGGKCPEQHPGGPAPIGCATCARPDRETATDAHGADRGAAVTSAAPVAAPDGAVEKAAEKAAPHTTPAILAAKALVMPDVDAPPPPPQQQQQQAEENSSGGGGSAGKPSRRKPRGGERAAAS